MSYLVLARKYRPQLFEDVVGQSHVTTTLTHAISAGRVAHALLFSGPRGTGKTTVARILAKAMNCSGRLETGSPHPCNTCRSCREITQGSSADVYEIDGASNNSVEQVRELRGNVSYMPVYSPRKIYIIDEVHMLSVAAFNALLKTLEEPPPHVMFMFATTEVHKIPVTILSRCQRHDMRRVSHGALKSHLEKLCGLEGVSVPSESLDLIAVEAGGSVRDSLSILDQIIGSAVENAVTHEAVLSLLGAAETSDVLSLVASLIRRDGAAVLSALNRFYTQGSDLRRLFSGLTQTLRNLLVLEVAGPAVLDLPDGEIRALGQLVQSTTRGFLTKALELLLAEEPAVRYALAPKMAIELALIKLLQVPDALAIDTLIRKLDTLQKMDGSPAFAANPPVGSGVSETRAVYATAPSAPPLDVPEPVRAPSEPREVHPPVPAVPVPAPAPEEVSAPPGQAPEPAEPAAPAWNPSDSPEKAWGLFLEVLRKNRPAMAPLLARSALKKVVGKSIEIEITATRFALGRLNSGKKKELEEELRGWFGPEINVTLHTIVAGEEAPAGARQGSDRLVKEAKDHPVIHEAVRVFGGNVDVNIIKEDDHERHG